MFSPHFCNKISVPAISCNHCPTRISAIRKMAIRIFGRVSGFYPNPVPWFLNRIRKNIERPFNLLKNQTGLEQVRVRSQHSLIARSIFSNIGILLLGMAGTRRKKKVNKPQQIKLFDLAA